MTSETSVATAELLLRRMNALGIDYVFGNAGTDFPSLIEAFARAPRTGAALPEPVLVAHETVAVGMAHGYFLATGRAQCVMVHVNVGLANALMGILNAASDNIPLLLCSGRTPVTEHGRAGSRSRPIHWGQEMRDQAAMLREAVKWDSELRYPEQAAVLVDRALAIAHSDPMGPVYLSLPREVLAEPLPEPLPLMTRQQPAKSGAPNPAAVALAVNLIRLAAHPVIIAQRPAAPGEQDAIADFAGGLAIPVVEFWPSRNVMASEHNMFAGGDAAPWLADADVVITIDALVPWFLDEANRPWNAKIVSIGTDPLFARTPVRSFPVDVALAGDAALVLAALSEGLARPEASRRDAIERRRESILRQNAERREAARQRAEKGAGRPIGAAWASRCLSEAKGEDAVVFNELGCDPSVMRFSAPNMLYSAPLSGGLGWALPAALGYQLADRERLVVACVGDGSYIFANPVACHLVAMAQGLPVLTIIFNNGIWNAVKRATLAMYPDGDAARSKSMPLTALSPPPDCAAVARAHGCWAERVEDGAELPAAIERAIAATRAERLPALLDVIVSA
jgi:acetolactate synthase-1/2/3 large subunit